jgi:hypothetical protein
VIYFLVFDYVYKLIQKPEERALAPAVKANGAPSVNKRLKGGLDARLRPMRLRPSVGDQVITVSTLRYVSAAFGA